MKIKKLLVSLGIILFLLIVIYSIRIIPKGFSEYNSTNSPNSSIIESSNSTQQTDENSVQNDNQVQENSNSKISAEELSKHNIEFDCWVSYKGKVYDVTSFLPKHKGGKEKILPYCGTQEEFKKAFEGQHETSKVSTLMKVGTFMGDFEVVGSV